MPSEGKRIGELLIEAGLVTAEQVAEALERQKIDGGRICSQLIRRGHLKADELLEFLRLQFGVAAVNLANYRIPPAILSLLPQEMARRHRVVPVNVLDNRLTVAMENPKDAQAVAEIESALTMGVDPLICPQAVIEEALAKYYPLPGADEEAEPSERKVLSLDGDDFPHGTESAETLRALTPLAWLKRVLFLGIKKRSREIHLEPREDDVLARYRSGSKLISGETLPLQSSQVIPSILLDYAGQDGRLASRSGEGWIKVRVRQHDLKLVFALFPVIYGERVVMKLIDEIFLRRPLMEQGMDKEDEARLRSALERKRGLFVIASPSANERNWTLYHLIDLIKNDAINIITLEPHLLFPLPGVSQTLYSDKAGAGPADILDGAMRQEPDVIGVCDLDGYGLLETCLIAASSSLVIITAAMANTLEVLRWLQGAHAKTLALAHLLAGIVSVRTLSSLCPRCRRRLEIKPDIVEGTRDFKVEEMSFQESPGCDGCEGTGRRGQLSLFEVFVPDDEVRELINTAAPAQVIYEEAQRRGMRTILESGLIKAGLGHLDVRDVYRVAPADTERVAE